MEITIQEEPKGNIIAYVLCPPQKRTIFLEKKILSNKEFISKKKFFLHFDKILFGIHMKKINNVYRFNYLTIFGNHFLPNVNYENEVCLGKIGMGMQNNSMNELIKQVIYIFWNTSFIFTTVINTITSVETYFNDWQLLKKPPYWPWDAPNQLTSIENIKNMLLKKDFNFNPLIY